MFYRDIELLNSLTPSQQERVEELLKREDQWFDLRDMAINCLINTYTGLSASMRPSINLGCLVRHKMGLSILTRQEG